MNANLHEIFILETSYIEALAGLLFASFCGAILGYDREAANKPAGLRTHMMVCIGAAGFMLLTHEMMRLSFENASEVAFDPSRVIQGIITGVGFLGAGTIIQSRHSIEGITTAAGIWVAAGVGAMCGAQFFGLAFITTAFAFLTLDVMGMLKRHWHRFGPQDQSESEDSERTDS